MTAIAIQLNALHNFSSDQLIDVAIARSPDVTAFCSALQIVRKVLHDNSEDPALLELNSLASKFRFRVLATPLPLNHPALIDADTESRLRLSLQTISHHYGELRPTAGLLTAALARLRSSPESPLWSAIEPHLDTTKRGIGFVIRPNQLASAAQEYCEIFVKGIRVLTDSQLRGNETFEELYFFGAMRWFPGFVFSAARAPKLVVARYSVLRDGPPNEPKFAQTLVVIPSEPALSAVQQDGGELPSEDVVPSVNIEALINRVTSSLARYEDGERSEQVDVRILLLEQGLAVLVPLTDSSSELVIDSGSELGDPVQRVKTTELRVGLAVIVRTEGGGGYVAPAADQILGNSAPELRTAQRTWKKKLNDVVMEHGEARILRDLRAAGGRLVNEQNLRNWRDSRWIRTQHREDFDAIFAVVGKSADADRCWRQMGVLQAAHQRAGALIRRRLMEQVRGADMSYLQRDGRMDFKLPGELGGGKITAIRISTIAPDVVRAPWSAVHRLIHAGD